MPAFHAAVVAIHIVSSVAGSEAPADDTPKHARAKEAVTLSAVIEAGEGKKRAFYTDAGPTIELGGKSHKTKPLSEAPKVTLSWHKIEPTAESMDNTASGDFAYEKIEYQAVEVEDWAGKA